jgi:hypothetical protein
MIRFDPLDGDFASDDEASHEEDDAELPAHGRFRSVSPAADPGASHSHEYLDDSDHPTVSVDGHIGASRAVGVYRVSSSIYLGSASVARNIEMLHRLGITHLLCCARECSNPHHIDVGFTCIPLLDRPPREDENPFADASSALERLTMSNEVVLVYCQRGVSRSPSVVMAYYISKQGLDFAAALFMVRESCPRVDPNAWFCSHLLRLENTR